MRLYATTTQLAAAPGGSTVPSGDAAALIRTASRVVDALLVGRVYDVDTDGLPTDPDVAQALTDATCAIVVELVATGATAPGASLQWDSIGIGSVSLSGRKQADGVTVLGYPVPSAALVALADVGYLYVANGPQGSSRPLDWITP